MSQTRAGRCQCGAVQYELQGEPVSLAVCHCGQCKRQSGSAFGMSLTVRKESFRLLCGALKSFTRAADSGRSVRCSFCPDCGTRIYHEPTYREGMLNIKPGTLEDPGFLAPTVEVWTANKHPWVEIAGDLVSFEKQPF